MIDYRSKQSGSSRIRSTPVTELRRFFEYARPNSSSNEDMSSNFELLSKTSQKQGSFLLDLSLRVKDKVQKIHCYVIPTLQSRILLLEQNKHRKNYYDTWRYTLFTLFQSLQSLFSSLQSWYKGLIMCLAFSLYRVISQHI